MCTNVLILLLSVFVMASLVPLCAAKEAFRRIDGASDFRNNILPDRGKNTSHETGRGFGSLFTLGKVLNFFPVGGERECQPEGYTVARAGICLNPYDCRQRDGRAAGDCAHGLGVCCVFEVTCGAVIQNNLTYFMSPSFPALWSGGDSCDVIIEKPYAGIMQLRVDFVHFTIGQPNRATGACDEDAMILGEGKDNFTVCGQNHGQHIYYTLSSQLESREAGDLPTTKSTRLSIRTRGTDTPRIWLLRLAMMPLGNSAPHDCLQYYVGNNGTIQSFNYAINGRHLASQHYRACVRKNAKMCGIQYSPCDNRSFRIGPSGNAPAVMDPSVYSGPGAYGGAGTGSLGPGGEFLPAAASPAGADQQGVDTMAEDQMMPVNDQQQQTQDDEVEGSGNDPGTAPTINSTPSREPEPSFMDMIWSFIWPSWIWGQARTWSRWSPYTQHTLDFGDKFRFYGYGNFGVGLQGFGRQRCADRITIPCENEYFVSASSFGAGVCDPHHCGSTFCPGTGADAARCHVQTSVTPFAVTFHFGPPVRKRSPEENIGVCLRFMQLPCEG